LAHKDPKEDRIEILRVLDANSGEISFQEEFKQYCGHAKPKTMHMPNTASMMG
jgi:hypothetical protein